MKGMQVMPLPLLRHARHVLALVQHRQRGVKLFLREAPVVDTDHGGTVQRGVFRESRHLLQQL